MTLYDFLWWGTEKTLFIYFPFSYDGSFVFIWKDHFNQAAIINKCIFNTRTWSLTFHIHLFVCRFHNIVHDRMSRFLCVWYWTILFFQSQTISSMWTSHSVLKIVFPSGKFTEHPNLIKMAHSLSLSSTPTCTYWYKKHQPYITICT